MRFFSGLAVVLLVSPLSALGAPIQEPPTAVREVTVYPGGEARVVRSGQVRLASGDQALVFRGLAAATIPDSMRVAVSGEGAARVGSVEVDKAPVAQAPRERERELRDRIEALRGDKAAARDRLETARTQLTFVEGLAELPAREGAGQALTGPDAAKRWPALLQRIGEGAGKARAVMRKAQRRQEDLQAEIEAAQEALERLGRGEKERVRVRVGLAAERAGPATVTLRYRVRGAEWQPLYEARLDTDEGTVAIVRKARVRQRTGTDWQDVRLSLATVAPVGGALPELDTWWVDFSRPRPMRERAAGSAGLQAADRGSGQASAPSWTAHGEFTPVYRVGGRVSVPGSNQAQTVVLGRREMQASLAVRAVPQQGERAWLTAPVTWDGEGALPPGAVSRYRDGAFVGKGRWAAWAPGEERAIAFGPDPRFEVVMRAVTDRAGEAGLISKKRVRTRHYRIELTNRHGRAIDGSLRFRIPVARDEAIEVAPWFPEPPDREDVGGRKGVFAWERTFPSGETAVIRAGYRLSVPAGKSVPGF